ncbi:serine-threonine/tyrosine-protein kinase catalytic domain-containing protein [Artemisia annua]|uniref:Serine-threonine/tyrosine-protein kinase catalytic domain-containing protein n=1 Tax=Artemisia annua TaxID=35608 RepID=A0A2U1PNB9_ARTAN|nr:serine-threonine/tyrosine-protein kinase catalytic domain-containing protein [Artemisia annua]
MYNHPTLASIALGTLLITAFITIVAVKRVRRHKKRPDCEEPGANNSSSVDHNLYLLTKNSFYKTKIVGDSWFGTVYKAQSPNGKIVAVKKLNQSKSQVQREFLAEMETLGKVKHCNLNMYRRHGNFDLGKKVQDRGGSARGIKKGQAVDVFDLTIVDVTSKKVMLQMVQIAAICIYDNPANRPSMLNVLEFLKGNKPDL